MKRLLLPTLILILFQGSVFAQNVGKPASGRYQVDTIPMLYNLITEVDTGTFMPTIRHLSSYYTRLFSSQEAIQAQNWLDSVYTSYGLSVQVQNFPYSPPSSDNVIATLTGKLYPEEYVLVGGHYDSFTYTGAAPGADDDASGTSGVVELARILSTHEFERSIIFCSFSAEEMGLIGSEYYASHAQALGMDILGYFNFDMIGYRYPGDSLHTDLIYPSSAEELAQFYRDVTAIYLPDFQVKEAEPIGGDSDHTSFNNNGYMGIFPFEDTPHYSPYIHSGQDLVGLSVNSPELAKNMIQANLASVVTLARPYSNVGIQPAVAAASLSIYPNPAEYSVTISTSVNTPAVATVYSSTGQYLMEKGFTGKTSVDISGLPAGLYFVTCVTETGISSQKMIVR